MVIIWILALIAIPIAALQATQVWCLLRTARFVYKSLDGKTTPTTRADRPGWYWFAVIERLASLALSLAMIGIAVFLTFPSHWSR
jgi:uncharacterized membrane protein